jgi:hypothetical protein
VTWTKAAIIRVCGSLAEREAIDDFPKRGLRHGAGQYILDGSNKDLEMVLGKLLNCGAGRLGINGLTRRKLSHDTVIEAWVQKIFWIILTIIFRDAALMSVMARTGMKVRTRELRVWTTKTRSGKLGNVWRALSTEERDSGYKCRCRFDPY